MISNVFWPRRLVEMLTFIDLNGDDDIDPDVATKVLEPAAAVPEKSQTNNGTHSYIPPRASGCESGKAGRSWIEAAAGKLLRCSNCRLLGSAGLDGYRQTRFEAGVIDFELPRVQRRVTCRLHS